MKRFEELPHTADISIRAYGRTLKELFENAAFGMFSFIADIEGLKNNLTADIDATASSGEELLVAWLDELLYNFYTKGMIFSLFEINEIDDGHLKAKARGRLIGENKNRLKNEIKAVTFHDLKIEKKGELYSVDIVFDV